MTLKVCAACNKEKDISQFSGDQNNKDKVSVYCKECKKKKNKESYSRRKSGGKQYLPSYGNASEETEYFSDNCEICNVVFRKRNSKHIRCESCTDLVKDVWRNLHSSRSKRMKVGRATPETIIAITKVYLKSTRCCYCNQEFSKDNYKSFDHILPCCRGGTNELANLAVCCINCNRAKAWQTLDEWFELCKCVCETFKLLG